MKAEDLTAYQANVFLVLNDGRAGQRFRDEAALELVTKHSVMIADRERRRFEPLATARAIIEAEAMTEGLRRVEEWNDQFRQPNPDGRFPVCKPIVGDKDSRCERCGNVGMSGPCPAVPREQRWGESQPTGDEAICEDISAVIESRAIADKISQINRLVTEVCEYKRTHILERGGYYPHSPGSILNAYREGDLDFQTAVSLLKAPELSEYERALIFAARAHGDQKRKWTGDPYIVHPIAVAGMLKDAGLDEDAQIAGLLHDCVEDALVTFEEIESEFGLRVCGLVREVTDFSLPSDGNRANRKRIDREHLATACDDAQSLKVADLINNTESICEYDPKFAAVYLPEKRALLEVLTRAEPGLLKRAWEVLEDGERRILELTKVEPRV